MIKKASKAAAAALSAFMALAPAGEAKAGATTADYTFQNFAVRNGIKMTMPGGPPSIDPEMIALNQTYDYAVIITGEPDTHDPDPRKGVIRYTIYSNSKSLVASYVSRIEVHENKTVAIQTEGTGWHHYSRTDAAAYELLKRKFLQRQGLEWLPEGDFAHFVRTQMGAIGGQTGEEGQYRFDVDRGAQRVDASSCAPLSPNFGVCAHFVYSGEDSSFMLGLETITINGQFHSQSTGTLERPMDSELGEQDRFQEYMKHKSGVFTYKP